MLGACSEQLAGSAYCGQLDEAVVGGDRRVPTVAVARAEVERAVGTVDDVADPAEAAGQQPLRPGDPVRIVRLEADAQQVLAGRFGRIRDVVSGPDGALYLCTSNRDGRNTPVAADDRIVKLSAVR